MPDIEFSFYDITDKVNNISTLTLDLTLEPKDYMVTDESNDMTCIPGIGDHGTQYGWNLGLLFLKKFTFIYDFSQDKVAFVRIKES